MKKLFEILSLICIAAILQGCPTTSTNTKWGVAYVLTASDTAEVYYSNVAGGRMSRDLFPSAYLQQIIWYPEQHNSVKHSEEKHELHLRKMTNNSEAVVIEAEAIYINDVLYDLSGYYDPADSVQMGIDALGQTYTIITHKPTQPPYDLADVIDELEKTYPDVVHRVNDTEWHNYKNYKYSTPTTYGLEELKIYLPEQETDTL